MSHHDAFLANTFDSLDPPGQPARLAILDALSDGEMPLASNPDDLNLDKVVEEMVKLEPGRYTIILPEFESRASHVRLFVERKEDGAFLVEGLKACVD